LEKVQDNQIFEKKDEKSEIQQIEETKIFLESIQQVNSFIQNGKKYWGEIIFLS